MKSQPAIRLLFFSFAIALVIRILSLEIGSWRERHTTNELCVAVANYLETGSIRSAYETLTASLKPIYPEACVSVIDNGRSFAPNCLSPNQEYQTTLCKAEANEGVRAEIHFPTAPVLGLPLSLLWLGISILISMLLLLSRAFATYISEKIVEESTARLFGEAQSQRAWTAKIFDWLIEKSGIGRSVRSRAREFDQKIQEFELKIREEAALRARKSAEADQSRAYIEKVAQIRHDIRSPLSSLFALLNTIEDEFMRQTLLTAIKRIQSMLDDLNQIEQSEKERSLVIAEVAAEEAVAALRKKFRDARSVILSIDYDGSKLSPIMVIPNAFRSILDNLLENAFDACSLNGLIELSVSSNASHCQITVQDNGRGIDPAQQLRLFKKNATQNKVTGTGLGLYTAKRDIESWGGKIEFEPLAEGSRFIVTLPVVQTGVTYVGLEGLDRIAVIDDDPATINALRLVGFDIDGRAGSFEDGQKLLVDSKGSDVTVLVDQNLDQGKFGTDLIGEFGDPLRSLLCTLNYDSTDVIRRAKQIGVKILPKPLCFLAMPTPGGPGQLSAVR